VALERVAICGKTWEEFLRQGATITGFKEGKKTYVEKILILKILRTTVR
jgi:hypothetical protein